MAWAKGQTGNPKGRPPKSRALADLLRRYGGKKPDGVRSSYRDVFAAKIWEGLQSGVITFGDGEDVRKIDLDGTDYIALARLVLTHIDGPARAEMDVTSGGQPVTPNVMFGYVPPAIDIDDEADGADGEHPIQTD